MGDRAAGLVADAKMLGTLGIDVRYRWTHDVSPEEHALALAILADERDRAARFVFESDRIGFASAHALCARAACARARAAIAWRYALPTASTMASRESSALELWRLLAA